MKKIQTTKRDKMETNEVPIPDTPECVASHCGVWACRSDILTALAGQLADGRIQALPGSR